TRRFGDVLIGLFLTWRFIMQNNQLKKVLLGVFGILLVGTVAGLAIGFSLAEDKKEETKETKDKDKATDSKDEKVVKTDSGLEYVDRKVGDGDEAKSGKRVTVHYTGTLKSNGKKFDSSVDRNEPFTFKLGVGEVIKGWDEGVAGMKVGGKRKLIIPSKLGYGSRGAGKDIPPDADLVF